MPLAARAGASPWTMAGICPKFRRNPVSPAAVCVVLFAAFSGGPFLGDRCRVQRGTFGIEEARRVGGARRKGDTGL